MRRRIFEAATLVAATWFVFAPVFRGGWMGDWDDALEVTGNLDLRDWAGLGRIWFAPDKPDYLPLKSTVQWVQWHLWHENVLGYHLTNVGLHLLSAFLVWHLLKKLGVRLAWLGGLIFAVHPLAVESVAWISELKNVLSLPLMLAALGAWIKWSDEGRSPAYFLSLGLFLAAMLCKSSVVMFPVILLLYCWWRRGRIGRTDLAACAPFFVISLILGTVTLCFQSHRALGGEVILAGGFLSRVAAAGFAIGFYLWRFIYPVGLMPIYPRWAVDPPALWQFWPWVVIVGALIWLVRLQFVSSRGRAGIPGPAPRQLLLGGGFFLINLLPALGFIPMSFLRLAWVADHFVYLPLVGLVGLIAAGLGSISGCEPKGREEREGSEDRGRNLRGLRGPPTQIAFCALVAIIVAALAIESRHYAEKFTDARTLWSYNVRRNPAAWAARNNLGNALLSAGRVPEAIECYEQALRLKPDYAEVHSNLGNVFAETGRAQEALAQYQMALQILPDYSEALNGLGNLLSRTGHGAEAVAQLERAIKSNPGNASASNNLGNTLSTIGRPAEAEAPLRRALELQPDYPEAHNNLGNVCLETGRKAEAMSEYREALRLRPDFVEARNNLGNVLMNSGRPAEAIAQFEQALQLRPGYAEAHYNLGLVLDGLGRTEAAAAQYRLALKFRPDFPEARAKLNGKAGNRESGKAENW